MDEILNQISGLGAKLETASTVVTKVQEVTSSESLDKLSDFADKLISAIPENATDAFNTIRDDLMNDNEIKRIALSANEKGLIKTIPDVIAFVKDKLDNFVSKFKEIIDKLNPDEEEE